MTMLPRSTKKLWLYVGTLLSSIFIVLSSIFIGWVGISLLNELTGALGMILCLFALALPIVLVVAEIRQRAKTPTPQVHAALSQPSGRTPLKTIFRTWRNMGLVCLPLGWWFCADAGGYAWYGWLVVSLTCLGGPLSFLCLQPHDALDAAGLVGFYSLVVAWFFWKPSGWSKAAFILLSVLWVVFGCAIVCLPI